jgi:hypothetical protein
MAGEANQPVGRWRAVPEDLPDVRPLKATNPIRTVSPPAVTVPGVRASPPSGTVYPGPRPLPLLPGLGVQGERKQAVAPIGIDR